MSKRLPPTPLRSSSLSNVLSLAPARPAELGDGLSIGDWDLLFEAVETRLSGIVVRAPHVPGREPQRIGDDGAAQGAVQECVAALRQLHGVLADERARHHQLARELHDVQSALTHARADLVITESQARRSLHQASHDSLTALPNRGHFIERIEAAVAKAQRAECALAALYLDLDGFKAINDLHGHAIGDEVLRIVAARLVHALRADDMVGRLGGDEFACLLSNPPGDGQLHHLVDKLIATVSAPLRLGTIEISVRPSIGVAIFPADGDSAEALLSHADAAMYRAKRQHTGCGELAPAAAA